MLVAHISDAHLGRKSPGDPHSAERLNSFRQALGVLAAAGPDVLVVAGDTFDGPSVETAIVEEAAASLNALRGANGAAIAVVVIPGNHDPAEADKLWGAFRKALGSSATVHLALEPALIALAEGKLLVEAYPCLTRFSAEPPWTPRLSVPAASGGVLRVVVAHGTLQGGPVPEGETDAYPFTQADIDALGADYVALGHFHGVYPAWDDAACRRSFCYSGTHEPDQFTGDAGYVILARVETGQPAALERVKVGRRQWRQLTLAGPADLGNVAALCEEARASGDPARYVVRFKVQGGAGWSVAEVQRLEALEASLRAVGAQLERRGQPRARVEVDALDLQGLPSGAIREALVALQGDLASTAEPRRRAVITAALQMGWEKVQEAGRT
jgi:DNA repair exonuclease SbcCD nuclease subunit